MPMHGCIGCYRVRLVLITPWFPRRGDGMMRGRRQWHSFGVSFLALVQSAGSVPEITAHVNANSPPLLHLDDGRPHAGNRPHVREADQSDRFPVDTSTGASFTSSRRTEQNNGDDDGNNRRKRPRDDDGAEKMNETVCKIMQNDPETIRNNPKKN